MNNRFGLDSRYFKEQLNIIIQNIEHYSPEEMHRALKRLAAVAKPTNECRHGESLDGLCNACADSGLDPRK